MTDGDPSGVLTAWDLLKVAFSSAVVAAIVGPAVTWLKEASQQKRNDRQAGHLLALKLVELLEEYARVCANHAQENEYLYGTEGGGAHGEMPTLPNYPPYDTWVVLPGPVSGGLQNLRSFVRQADQEIDDNGRINGPEEAFETANERMCHAGYKAWCLARRLRQRYNLGGYEGGLRRSDIAYLAKNSRRSRARGFMRLYEAWRTSLLRSRLRNRRRRIRLRIRRFATSRRPR